MREIKADSPFDELLSVIVHQLNKKFKNKKIDLNKNKYKNLSEILDEFKNAKVGEMVYRNAFKDIFSELKYLKLHVILTLDEFDSAEEIFKSPADYELFRTLVNPEYAITLILISRRQLYMIEKQNENNSVFHAAFQKKTISGLTDNDIERFHENLLLYDIELNDEQKNRINYYAGRSPYIYSAFCHQLVDRKIDGQNNFNVDEIFKQDLTDTVNNYAEVAYNRLKTDNQLSKLIGILFGPMINVTRQDKDALISMGYLTDKTDESKNYIALSEYWTDFLKEKNYCDDSWKNLISTEKKLKKIISKELNYDDDYYINILTQAYKKFANKNFEKKGLYDNFIKKNLERFNKHSTVIDVMSLEDTFYIIRYFWKNFFFKHFNPANYDDWKIKFELCAKARDPFAHGHEEYLTDNQRIQVNTYCNEILDCLKNFVED